MAQTYLDNEREPVFAVDTVKFGHFEIHMRLWLLLD